MIPVVVLTIPIAYEHVLFLLEYSPKSEPIMIMLCLVLVVVEVVVEVEVVAVAVVHTLIFDIIIMSNNDPLSLLFLTLFINTYG